MPSRIAHQLNETAEICRELARRSMDKDISRELEEIAGELDTKAQKLNDVYAIVEAI